MSASPNDRLYDELLSPVAEDYFDACRKLSALPSTADTAYQRAWLRGRLVTLAEHGNRLARVLEVPEPLWAGMQDLAGMNLDR
ncbi:hypothetical protein [Actinoplanes rectilineatus]|uniref:hypothetical protein n=1 Tax=Actinoplanes rectilineatus TaxID=113571 RepID=UPI0005F2FAEC|nr:hypothetical protein [Actinoplanes rectilineatus]